MDISSIIKKTNVSTIFILPLFNEIANGITYKFTRVPFGFLTLLYEYGFLYSYCYYANSESNNSIFITFDGNQVKQKLVNTNNPHLSLHDILIESVHCKNNEQIGNVHIYELTIPDNFSDDILKIKKGEYSRLSDKYKEVLLVSGKILKRGLLKHELPQVIMKNNLAYGIANKEKRIKDLLENSLKCSLPEDVELYQKFSNKKETLQSKFLN
jgi:hypothetical protein